MGEPSTSNGGGGNVAATTRADENVANYNDIHLAGGDIGNGNRRRVGRHVNATSRNHPRGNTTPLTIKPSLKRCRPASGERKEKLTISILNQRLSSFKEDFDKAMKELLTVHSQIGNSNKENPSIPIAGGRESPTSCCC